ncbi:YcaO-like family protein [Vibrio lamellibrachiae]|uniref:YcaO-like family protein n=1 Tax=Vibrio lamellibrachiae TaxID=2910253 RepID=UPI003D0B40DB
MMDIVPTERQMNANQAIENIVKWFEAHDIDSSLTTSRNYLVATVQLFNSKNEFLASGAGKGPWAIIGAYYEAFEHLLLEHQFISTNTSIRSLRYWLGSEDHHEDCLFGKPLKEYEDGLLKFSRYYSLLNARTYLIPEVLINPFYKEPLINSDAFQFLKPYSVNSGWASGSTFEEAILHGANEVIECHHMSELYKQCIGHKTSSGSEGFYKIKLPSALLVHPLSIPNLDQVSVVMSKTILGSYFCTCVLLSDLSPMALRSSGVSYSEYHAIERALFELEETIELFTTKRRDCEIQAANLLSCTPKLSRLIKLSSLDELPYKDLTSLSPTSHYKFSAHYRNLIQALDDNNWTLLFHTAFQTTNIWLVSVFIPGLERFNVIDKGHWVVPLGNK